MGGSRLVPGLCGCLLHPRPPGSSGSIWSFPQLPSTFDGICMGAPSWGTRAGPSLGLWLYRLTMSRWHIAGRRLCWEPAQPFKGSFNGEGEISERSVTVNLMGFVWGGKEGQLWGKMHRFHGWAKLE